MVKAYSYTIYRTTDHALHTSRDMSITPKLSALRYGPASAPNIVELYLDYVCPFSKKQFLTVYNDVLPILANKEASKVAFIFRPQVQSWHPASTMCHESAIAVALLQPDSFWKYSAKLFEESDKFYDSHTVSESRSQTYYRLSKLAGAVGVNESKFLDLLTINPAGSPDETGKNGGNKVTDLLKVQVKLGRQNGIHVSPTVLLNGVVDGSVSSSFTKDDWQKYFDAL